jgi:hypothetical protein
MAERVRSRMRAGLKAAERRDNNSTRSLNWERPGMTKYVFQIDLPNKSFHVLFCSSHVLRFSNPFPVLVYSFPKMRHVCWAIGVVLLLNQPLNAWI